MSLKCYTDITETPVTDSTNIHTLQLLILSITSNGGCTCNAGSRDDITGKSFSVVDSMTSVATDDDLNLLQEEGP